MKVTAATASARHHITVRGDDGTRYDEVITPESLDFLRELHRRFTARRHALVDARVLRSGTLDFLSSTQDVRDDPTWKVAPAPSALVDRRVEITGQVDPKMAINALNSGANVWMADLEDATSPTWSNVMEGHLTILDAVNRTLSFDSPDGREYRLGDDLAAIVVRPRGWHLLERHVYVDNEPIPASLFDFGLFAFHNAAALANADKGPFVYIPKLESHLEARLWKDIFDYTERKLDLATGTIRATVLIETITAAFEMEEILYELRRYVTGLGAGRWDYVFSLIKQFGTNPDFVLPDRADISMNLPFMKAYTDLLVQTAHKRGAHAIGGIAAISPSDDAEVDARAMDIVRADKEAEAAAGFDGTLISHPRLVDVVREAFTSTNQLDNLRTDVTITAADLLDVASVPKKVTADGLERNVAIVVRYLDAWLGGLGGVSWAGRPEDASTAEIVRSQLWQWIKHGTPLDDGTVITADLVNGLLATELERLSGEDRPEGRVEAIEDIVRYGALGTTLPASMTEYAYRTHLL